MFRIQEVTVWVLPIFLCERESFRDTYEPFFQFGNQDCRPSWTSTLWRGDQDSCITVTHKSHLVSQDCLIFLLVYVSHFALFCIQNTFQDPYVSPKLSLIWFIPIQQADSCPASCVCPAHRSSWPFSSASDPAVTEKPDLHSLLVVFPVLNALLFGFWPPLSTLS